MVVIVMGPAGAGKSTVGRVLARRLGWPFVEGDDYHDSASVQKMSAGIPLTDEDRAPWLTALADLIRDRQSRDEDFVLTCSALRRAYREQLGLGPGVLYVYLKGSRQELERRLRARSGHFAGVNLLDSQLETLEEPCQDEPTLEAQISTRPSEIADSVMETLSQRWRLFRSVRPRMLSKGDKVTIRYRDASGLAIEEGWSVLEYDDGLVKLFLPGAAYREGTNPGDVRTIPDRTRIVNLRSFDFLSVDIE